VSLVPVRKREDLHAAFKVDPTGVVLATRLALYAAIFGTTLGFGEVVQPPVYAAYRLQLLHAMELFAVAHEYGHFVAEERISSFRGQLVTETQLSLEHFCDDVGLTLSRDCCGDNYLAFCGVGAIVFLRSAEVSEEVRAMLAESSQPSTGIPRGDGTRAHPPAAERVATIKAWIQRRTAPDQRDAAVGFLAEYDLIATTVNEEIRDLVRNSRGSGDA
jgi:hypothetical protein